MRDTKLISNMMKATNLQFDIHKNSNIFCTENSLHFSDEMKKNLVLWRDMISTLTPQHLQILCENYKASFMKAFYNLNQYIYFSKEHEILIHKMYREMLHDLENTNLAIETVEQKHFQRIKKFIAYTNPSVCYLNNNEHKSAKHFVCAEYSAKFLIQLLSLDLNRVMEPILDIGCGKDGFLVHYLRNQGLQAYGFDRNASGKDLEVMDWLTYEYGQQKWGLIVSNLSFSSHFLYHHLHNENLSDQFATTYMKILVSLKKNGKWIYAPSIPFFEDLLPSKLYCVEREKIHEDFSKTTIKKL